MKRLNISLLALLIFACAPLEKLKSSDQTIHIDGANNDWPDLAHFDSDLGIHYGVTFDENNLYIMAKTSDEKAKRRIISSGLTVWIDANGKKRKKLGIKYPLIQRIKEQGRRPENRKPNEMLNEIQLNNLMIQGVFSDDMQVVQKHNLKIDFEVMIGFDSTQNLLYEMKMPLVLLKSKAKDDLEQLAIGFEVSEINSPMQGERPANGGGPRGGTGGRPGGGGPPEGPRDGGPPSGAQNTNASQTSISWYRVEL